uniref:Transcriptional regulator n=1 Tax=Heterorhabditis bacteriophora TaxID=37862 RepID=A0A1I7X804_HETBA
MRERPENRADPIPDLYSYFIIQKQVTADRALGALDVFCDQLS